MSRWWIETSHGWLDGERYVFGTILTQGDHEGPFPFPKNPEWAPDRVHLGMPDDPGAWLTLWEGERRWKPMGRRPKPKPKPKRKRKPEAQGRLSLGSPR